MPESTKDKPKDNNQPKEIKPRKPRKPKKDKKEHDYSKLSSQGTKIMTRAQEIRLQNPGKAWNDCVKLSGEEFKQKNKSIEKNNL